MKRSTNFRYKSSSMDFMQDGSSKKERVKGKDKRLLGKWSRKKFIKQLEYEVNT